MYSDRTANRDTVLYQFFPYIAVLLIFTVVLAVLSGVGLIGHPIILKFVCFRGPSTFRRLSSTLSLFKTNGLTIIKIPTELKIEYHPRAPSSTHTFLHRDHVIRHGLHLGNIPQLFHIIIKTFEIDFHFQAVPH